MGDKSEPKVNIAPEPNPLAKPKSNPTIISPVKVSTYVINIKPEDKSIMLGTEVHFLPNLSIINPTG